MSSEDTVKPIKGADGMQEQSNHLYVEDHSMVTFDSQHLEIEYYDKSLFTSPTENTIFVHACNCKGIWGGGIARDFKIKYPDHYQIYHDHCENAQRKQDLVGTCLLIQRDGVKVACLFTVFDHKARPHNEDGVIMATQRALWDLIAQIRDSGFTEKHALAMPKINAGLFGIDWEKTARTICNTMVPHNGTITSAVRVYAPGTLEKVRARPAIPSASVRKRPKSTREKIKNSILKIGNKK